MNKKQLLFHEAPIAPAGLMTNGVAIDTAGTPISSDGALLLNARAMRTGDYEYLAFEINGSRDRGFRFDEVIVGRMEKPDVVECLSQFEGLPITDEHVFVQIGERSETAAGTVLVPGKMKGKYVNTRAVVHDPKTIMKITSGDASELSIGFYSEIEWVDNPQNGDPDFYLRKIDLNHLAVVKEGRAGPDARLSNHKAKLDEETKAMKTIIINGKNVEVSDEVAAHIEQLENAKQTAEASVTTVTAERDTAVGELAVANKAAEGNDEKALKAAAKIATEHATFIEEATNLDHDTAKLEIGNYDGAAIKREILTERGYEVAEDDSAELVNGMWKAELKNAKPKGKDKPALKQKGKNTRSAIDGLDPDAPKTVQDVEHASRQRTHIAYFGGGKKKKAE